MQQLTSVLISYHNNNRLRYQICAEFLRLAGIYVCEDVSYPKNMDCDVTDWSKYEFSFRYRICGDAEDEVQAAGVPETLGCLRSALEEDFSDTDFFACFNSLSDIFNRYSLVQAGVTLQYFKMGVKPTERAGIQFEKAAEAVTALMDSDERYRNNRHICYARLYCLQKANLVRFLCQKPLVCFMDVLAGEVLELTGRFPDFSNIWVLLGLVYEISRSYTREVVDAFQRAIRAVGMQPYVSNIYYFLGKRCEGYESLRRTSEEAYAASCKAMPKYRNLYKVAGICADNKDGEKALAYFERCLVLLRAKEDYLDPLEQEYFFKVSVHVCYLYVQREDYYHAILNANQALKLRAGISGEGAMTDAESNPYTMFCRRMYRDKAQEYIDLILKRMGTKQVYRYLAEAYQIADMREEADKYWALARR